MICLPVYGTERRDIVLHEKEYMVEIEEKLQRVVPVRASSEIEAINRVRERYYNQQIILDAEDMKDVNFKNYARNDHRIRDSSNRDEREY